MHFVHIEDGQTCVSAPFVALIVLVFVIAALPPVFFLDTLSSVKTHENVAIID